MEKDSNQKMVMFKDIEEKLEKLASLNSQIEDVLLFCDCYQELDYKMHGDVHRIKIGYRLIPILKLYIDKYINNSSINELKYESALIMWDFSELREEATRLREEALEAQPDLISSPLLPPYWYEGKPFSLDKPDKYILTEFDKENLF